MCDFNDTNLERVNKILCLYMERLDLIDYQNSDYDNINRNHIISQKVNLLNEIWSEFIPSYQLVNQNKSYEFVFYILNCNSLNILDILRYSINRLDELRTDFECRTFYFMSDYNDFIFINQPYYDNLLIEILSEIHSSTYSHLISPIMYNYICVYKFKYKLFNDTLQHIYNKLNNDLETSDLCKEINSLNIV